MEDRIACELLKAAYIAEVKKRGAEAVLDKATEENLRKVSRWLTNGIKPGLVLFGGVGNGKSTMAKAVAAAFRMLRETASETLQTDRWRLTEQQQAQADMLSSLPIVDFVTAQEIANIAADDGSAGKMEAIAKSGFLIVDDLGCEPTTVRHYGTDISPVIELLYRRYDNMRPTIATSNLGKNDIREYYGERVADRVNEIFDRLFYSSGSYRSSK